MGVQINDFVWLDFLHVYICDLILLFSETKFLALSIAISLYIRLLNVILTMGIW